MPALALVVLVLLAIAPPALGQTVLYVDDDAAGAANGSSWADAFTRLQTALAVASAGTEIRVGAGLYRPSSSDPLATFLVPDGVTVRGGYAGVGAPDPDLHAPQLFPTLLDGDLLGNDSDILILPSKADNSRHVVTVPAGATATLIGVTIQRGAAIGPGSEWGAGVLVQSATLTMQDCNIAFNLAFDGGAGIYSFESALALSNCRFVKNIVNGQGGFLSFASGGGLAMSSGSLVASNCSFIENSVSNSFNAAGGGLFMSSSTQVSASLTGCLFADNRAQGGPEGVIITGQGTGGGLHASTRSVLDLVDTTFVGNGAFSFPTGSSGGGAYLAGESRLTGCRFLGNNATAGDALSITEVPIPGVEGGAAIVNSIFAGNGEITSTQGAGAISVAGAEVALHSSTLWGNRTSAGAALHVTGADAAVDCRNTIVWGNVASAGGGYAAQVLESEPGLVTLTSCNVEGLPPGTGTDSFALDPLFVDADGADNVAGTEDDDLRLAPGSPCIDAGNSQLLPADELDLDCDGDVSETLPLDLAGRMRRHDDPITPDSGSGGAPVVDMGAFEHGAPLPSDAWTDLGGGSASSLGVPVFAGSGTLCAGSSTELALHGAAPGAPLLLLVSPTSSPVAIFGGTLHAFPSTIQILLAAHGGGGFFAATNWPAGLPSGVNLWLQMLVADGGGVILSNGLRASVP